MPQAILEGLSLVDVSGYVIIGSIVATLIVSVAANLIIRSRYASLARDLKAQGESDLPFTHTLLSDIVADARRASARSGESSAQAIVEEHFQTQLRWLLLGERFIRAATGLVLILGLSGTFYGLTSSIGKLARLVSAEGASAADVTQSLTAGLTQALSGMSVAFSGSLFGIVSAVILTVFGIVSNVTDRRMALMVQIETYLERRVPASPGREAASAMSLGGPTDQLERLLAGFGQSVAQLESTVGHFDSALQAFATSTRDFREFNLHLKDNVQRMSLSFGDFSETLKSQIGALKTNGHS